PAHVVVLTDRRGADIVAVDRHREQHEDVATDARAPMRRSAPGGWSQRRNQQRAENTWDHNAGDVAVKVVEAVRRIGANVVVLAGDVRAVQLLRDGLPREVASLVRLVDGTRHAGGSPERLEEEVAHLVATVAASETTEALRLFRQELGQ